METVKEKMLRKIESKAQLYQLDAVQSETGGGCTYIYIQPRNSLATLAVITIRYNVADQRAHVQLNNDDMITIAFADGNGWEIFMANLTNLISDIDNIVK